MNSRPTGLKIAGEDRLHVEWDDGTVREYTFNELGQACPCATCREKRRADSENPEQLPVLSAAELQPIRVLEMKPVGNYAYTIHFSDGHDTGIFQFDLLWELGRALPRGGE